MVIASGSSRGIRHALSFSTNSSLVRDRRGGVRARKPTAASVHIQVLVQAWKALRRIGVMSRGE
jgi:hypothetical protein